MIFSGTGTLLPVSATMNANDVHIFCGLSFLLCPRLPCLLLMHVFIGLLKQQLFSRLAGRRTSFPGAPTDFDGLNNQSD
jgi:hypothetical protein